MKIQPTRRGFLQFSSALMVFGPEALLAQAGRVATIVGAGLRGTASEGDAANEAHLNNPYGLVESPDRSSLYFVDNGSNRVLRLDIAQQPLHTFLVHGVFC